MNNLPTIRQLKNGDYKIVFGSKEAKGTIHLRPSAYGLSIDVDNKPLCQIDLYHMSELETDETQRCVQVVIDPPDGGDNIAFARRYPDDRVEVFFEVGVQVVRTDQDGIRYYGYPQENK